MFLDQAPVLSEHLEPFEEASVLSIGPTPADPYAPLVSLGDDAVLS